MFFLKYINRRHGKIGLAGQSRNTFSDEWTFSNEIYEFFYF